jgi:hypothetical protein
MSTLQQIVTTIHDVVDDVTTAVEDIHRAIGDVPLSLLASLEVLEEPVKQVREVRGRTLGAIYGLIRRVNDRVERLAS